MNIPDGVMMKNEDIINIMMFGSGGSATALEKQPGNELLFRNFCDGSGWNAIVRFKRTETMMQGNKVFEFAINDVVDNMTAFFHDFNLKDDIDYYAFHQAQKLILDTIAIGCELPEDQVLTSYEEYGNTSGASIPITLCHNLDKFKDKDNLQICSCGFGVGLSMGISYFQLPVQNILPVIVTDEHFDEHRLHNGELYSRNVFLMNPKTSITKLVARELDNQACNLGFYGSKEILKELQSQLFWKDCEIFDDELNLVAQNTSRTYDSVIFDMAVYDMDKVVEEAGFLKQQGVLSTNSSVILIAEDKDDDTTLQSSMKLLSDSLTGDCRVNAVVYKMESLDLFPKILDRPEWLERKISMKNSSDMVRPFFISKTIEKLVSMDLLAVTSTIVHISDIVNEFM